MMVLMEGGCIQRRTNNYNFLFGKKILGLLRNCLTQHRIVATGYMKSSFTQYCNMKTWPSLTIAYSLTSYISFVGLMMRFLMLQFFVMRFLPVPWLNIILGKRRLIIFAVECLTVKIILTLRYACGYCEKYYRKNKAHTDITILSRTAILHWCSSENVWNVQKLKCLVPRPKSIIEHFIFLLFFLMIL